MYDLIIIGGGPAGLTASVYAARKKLIALLISKDLGGQVNWTGAIENYMGYQFVDGPELMKKFEEQVKQFPIEIKLGESVTGVKTIENGFNVTTADGKSYQSRALIIASGKRPRGLNVPGEDKFIGRGLSYCAICDGPLFSDMNVAVAGGGNSAVEAVIDLLKIASHIYLISATELTADPLLIDRIRNSDKVTPLIEHNVLEISGNKFVEGLKVRDSITGEVKEFKVSAVFVEVGLTPNSDFAREVAQFNDCNEIVVNCENEVKIPGLFAAGDVTSVPEKQIVIAAGEGAKAALSANRYLQRLKE